MAKGDVKFCRVRAYISHKYEESLKYPPGLGNSRRVLDSIIDVSDKPKLLKDLFNDSDITKIYVDEFVDPWYLTNSEYHKTSIMGWDTKPSVSPCKKNYRPYGTPEEVKKIETIWTSLEECERILRTTRE